MGRVSQLKNKLAWNKLQENKFLVVEDMVLETRDRNLKFNMGEEIVLGAGKDDNLVIREIDKLYVVEDPEVAQEVVENCVCKEELSDIQYKKFKIVEAQKMKITTSDLVKSVADDDEIRDALKDAKKRKESLFEIKKEGVTLPYVERKQPTAELREMKMKKLAERKFMLESDKNCEIVEAVEILENPECAKNIIMLDDVKVMGEEAEDHINMDNADEFMAEVKKAGGSVKTGDDKKLVATKALLIKGDMDPETGTPKEVKPAEEGEEVVGEVVIGLFDPETNSGLVYPSGEFKDVAELEAALKSGGFKLKDGDTLDAHIQLGKADEVEAELDAYANSDKSEACKEKCKKGLCNCGMSDEMADAVIECLK